MPRKAQIPDHWKEDAEQPDWMQQEEEAVYEPMPVNEEMVYDEEEDYVPYPGVEEENEFILGEEKSPTEYIQPDMTETERLEQEYQDLLGKKIEKQQIKQQKSKIRKLKYSPIFDTAASIRGGIDAAAGKISAIRGTPEERQVKKAMFKQKIKTFAAKSQGAMDKLGGMGNDGTRNINFGIGSSAGNFDMGAGQKMDLLGDGTGNVPKILQGPTVGSNMFSGNLIGGSGSMMNTDFFGMATGKTKKLNVVKTRTRKKIKRKTKKKKTKKKKTKKKIKRRKRPPAGRSNAPAIMKGGLY